MMNKKHCIIVLLNPSSGSGSLAAMAVFEDQYKSNMEVSPHKSPHPHPNQTHSTLREMKPWPLLEMLLQLASSTIW